jgi:ABC-type Fe3+-hydroxamate transport system substrate-binding protein
MTGPQRIVCLTEETVETPCLLGQEDRIVGVTGHAVHPGRIAAQPGRDSIPAVAHGRITDIKSPLILQPGPAALTYDLDAVIATLTPEEMSA